MSRERVYRWRVGAVAAGALVALGLLYASPLLLAATAIPLGYVVYGAVSSVPTDAAVAVERSFDEATPPPGETVTVRLTVENVSEATLPDLRVVDGVPDDLAVVDGSARGSFVLRPGESATVAYDVVAKRGDFPFADPVVRLRSLGASRLVTETVPAAGEGELSSLDPVSAAPVGSTTPVSAGTHPTDSGGEGLEFHSTREYRPGDSISRIDWRRFAKSKELSTVSYREERAVRVVVAVDARPVGRVRPRAGAPTAASLGGYAAERIYETLVNGDVTTSVAAFGVDGGASSVPTGAGPIPWVDGERADATAVARTLFDAVQRVADDPGASAAESTAASTDGEPAGPTLADRTPTAGEAGATPDRGTAGDRAGPANRPDQATPDGGADAVEMLLSQFPATAQVVLVTPLADDWPVSLVRRLRRRGYPVVVLSPDATGGGSLGGRVAGHERGVRLADVSATGAAAVDWDRGDPVERSLAAALSRLPGGSRG
ncbi:hypothetical protein C475_09259 [Halosimplex carlsbadense 2-9-1]|uniref:DUF58 domain-containing protein n=1 Tax=Halosimplex carlsbadense 2-9-1 TaxID=797114 RepID=M0CQV3_9EURY|nr:DUF58 domain-containing protein [Halosimplex carlsbadense]ELZ25635.1 hypothetical protein C475_09259 [Halosimplex carlsbadense 2-9-1]